LKGGQHPPEWQSIAYLMLERISLFKRRVGQSVFRAGGWREGLMGDFKALWASRKLSLMWADRFKRTRLFCFWGNAKKKIKKRSKNLEC